ncbi:MAG: glycosyltransferase [Candidatus Nanohaloarchaea archaeon]|nr:glycosyltransferase [Candidatus Nanohaloarchaea archaeon]
MMVTYIAWMLIAGSVFLAVFYLNLFRHTSSQSRDSPAELSSSPDVTLIMPAYNEEGTIREALENALNLDYPNYRVLMVDDGSTDSTLDIASEFAGHEKLTVLEHEENQGKSAALNTALEVTDSEYVAVQDADSSIDEGTLEEALAKFEQNDDLGAVIASIRPLWNDNFVRKLQFVQYRLTNFYRSLMAHIDTIDVTPGAFSLYRTSDLKEVGGFDVGNLTEDLDIAWRLRRLGREIDMVYRKRSNTEYPPTLLSLYRQRVQWARGSIQNAWKHRDMFLNREYGWFGTFQLPVHILSPLIAVVSLFLVGTGLARQAYSFLLNVSAVGLTAPAITGIELMPLLLRVQWKIYVPLAVSLVLAAYLIRTAYRKSQDPVQHPMALAAYYLGFFVLSGFFWTAAIIKELLHSSRVWT